MTTLQEILARAQALREETALGSIDPERAGGIMYDTLQQINQLQLAGGLVISKIYASVAAMQADSSPVSDLTGSALKPGRLVVIVPSDTSSADLGSVYRFDGMAAGASSWSFVGKIGGYPMDTTPTQGSTKAVTSGGVYEVVSQLGDDVAVLMQAYKNLAPWAFKGTPSIANPLYKDVAFFPTNSAGVGLARYGYSSALQDYMMSPIFDLGEIGENYSLTFSVGEVLTGSSSVYPGIVYFDENMLPYSYHLGNANPRTVSGTISSNLKYIRLLFKFGNIMHSYIKDNISGETLFDGSKVNLAEILPKEDILDSEYWKNFGPNSKGDWIGWNFASTNAVPSGTGGYKNDVNYPYFKNIGQNATDFSFGISKLIELPKGVSALSLEFSVGEVDTTMALRILNPSAGTANYYTANANPRTVTIDTNTYTHVQLYFKAANYANCYIKDNTNNVMLWQGGE